MSIPDSISIYQVSSAEDLSTIGDLFSAYAASLPINLSYQNFSHELSSLPGKYDPKSGGALLLARSTVPSSDSGSSSNSHSSSNSSTPPTPSGAALGCVALRAFEPPLCCEMKRLYVTESGRGQGIGKKLLARVVQAARDLGYREIRLDTLRTMHTAIAMYRAVGFREIEPYYETPILAETLFLGLTLE
jgi:ribosomal protein S18 acetylase RimI-like enzyme